MVDDEDAAAALFPERVGDRLRVARIKAGLDLSDIAARTRVPQRHLQAIEAGDYGLLPGATYCVGFVKAYARAVGEDEAAFASAVRVELNQSPIEPRSEYLEYQVADPAQVPSKLLAWTAAAIALLVLIGWGVWRSTMMNAPQPAMSVANAPSPEPLTNARSTPIVPPPLVNPAGEVVLTATNTVWLRIYDASDKVLFEKEMATGERFVVPPDANNPQIRTGRADLIAVTVGGKPVPALGPGERTIRNVGISAAALAARPVPTAPSKP